MSSLHSEFVRSSDERQARELGDLGCRSLSEIGSRIDARSHGCPTKCKTVYCLERVFDAIEIVRENAFVAGPLLPKREWRGVLHMRPADLNDVFPRLGLRADRIVKSLYGWDETLLQIHRRRDIHGRWKRIV